MAWVLVKETPASNLCDHVGSSTTLQDTHGATTLNNIMIVACWGSNTVSTQTAGGVTCSDDAVTPNTYTQLAFQNNTAPSTDFIWCAVFIATIASRTAGGNLDPKITVDHSASTIVGCCSEWSGGSLVTDGSSSNSGLNTSPPTCGNMSTTNAADLLIAVMMDSTSANPATVTTPTSYTRLGAEVNGSLYDVGEAAYYLPGATVTNNNPAWNTQTGSNAGFVCVQVALKPAASFVGDEEGITYSFSQQWCKAADRVRRFWDRPQGSRIWRPEYALAG